MTKEEVKARIGEIGVIPAIRVSSKANAEFAADAVIRGGIPVVEITMTVPGAIGLISSLAKSNVKVIVGAGTVLDVETAQYCVDAGANFLTAPGYNPALVEFAVRHQVLAMPGAMTPTEVTAAWRAGADLVKVFPCGPLGGDRYIKALHTALPQIPLVAAGGVNQQTAAGFIVAGAWALGVGTELIPAEAIERRQAKRIAELAHRFLGFVREARERLAPAT